MLIDDGYTESFDQFRVRRFISSERRKFDALLKSENFGAARSLFASHFSDSDGKRISLELVPEPIAALALTNPTEGADISNLKSGLRLLLSNPLLAIRPCSMCLKWWFDNDTNKIVQIGGQNLLRPDYALPLCQTDKGCQKGTPENPRSFNERNQQAFNHWQQWRHVGCPCPEDAIVRRNWMWFESIKENHGLRQARNRLPQPAHGR